MFRRSPASGQQQRTAGHRRDRPAAVSSGACTSARREFIHKCPRASCDDAKALAPEVSPLFGADVPIALFPEGATGCDPFAPKTTRGPHVTER